jgi:hypothetical protein
MVPLNALCILAFLSVEESPRTGYLMDTGSQATDNRNSCPGLGSPGAALIRLTLRLGAGGQS